jgi:hypothetical protein
MVLAVVLAVISGFAAQLCSIGHGPILPVLFLAPYAAFFLLDASSSFTVWMAALQFTAYAAALIVASARGLLGKVSVALLLFHCIGVVAATLRVL